jgi:small subunit ribosomal protein S11
MIKHKKQVLLGLGIANIKTTFNNSIITISDSDGNALCWSSAGTSGFKGTRKATSYAAQIAAKEVALKAIEFGVKKLEIILKGKGTGKETCLRTLSLAGFDIISIEDKTSVPHNGCRPPKKRRL